MAKPIALIKVIFTNHYINGSKADHIEVQKKFADILTDYHVFVLEAPADQEDFI